MPYREPTLSKPPVGPSSWDHLRCWVSGHAKGIARVGSLGTILGTILGPYELRVVCSRCAAWLDPWLCSFDVEPGVSIPEGEIVYVHARENGTQVISLRWDATNPQKTMEKAMDSANERTARAPKGTPQQWMRELLGGRWTLRGSYGYTREPTGFVTWWAHSEHCPNENFYYVHYHGETPDQCDPKPESKCEVSPTYPWTPKAPRADDAE